MRLSIQQYLQHNIENFNHWNRFAQTVSVKALRKLFHEDEINNFLQDNMHKDCYGFIESALDRLNIDITLHKNQLENIPSYGRVVLIANHPLGAVDALALLSVLKEIREDIKIVATSMLAQIENLSSIIIPVDNIRGKIDKQSLQEIYKSLNNEELVIIFPAGEVSRANMRGIKDAKWRSGFLKIAAKMQAPILPVFINAKNSRMFYVVSSINSLLATALLPGEIFKFYGKPIEFIIGRPVPFESYNIPSLSTNNLVKLFQKHLMRIAHNKTKIFRTYNSIALAENTSQIKALLLQAKELGNTRDDKKILLYSSTKETPVLKELGRLREISFRQAGEGSGKKRDIDKYDLLYDHIILWDDKNLEIVGSYRVLKTKDIDTKSLYTSTLFDYQESFASYLQNGLELGRSFIQPKYWNSRALDYLWQGIGAYLRANTDIRYMFGPVSISKTYNHYATSLLIYFYRHYFPSSHLHVKHVEPFIISAKQKSEFDQMFTLNNYKEDLAILKERLQLFALTIPTLYKQYGDLCEVGGVQFIDFGVDKSFDYCVDGYILVQIDKLKEQKKARYINPA